MVTFAPGTTAPPESVIVPRTVPVTACAKRLCGLVHRKNAPTARDSINLMICRFMVSLLSRIDIAGTLAEVRRPSSVVHKPIRPSYQLIKFQAAVSNVISTSQERDQNRSLNKEAQESGESGAYGRLLCSRWLLTFDLT